MRSTDETRDRIRQRLEAIAAGGRVDKPAPSWDRVDQAESGPDPGDGDPGLRAPEWLTDQAAPARSRLAPGRRGVVALAAVALVAAVIGVVFAWRDRPVAQAVQPVTVVSTDSPGQPGDAPTPAPAPADPVAASPPAELVISVVGLVRTAGLVHLPAGARIADALAAAGGARDGADLLGLNLAQRLNDGDQILVGLAPRDGAPVAVGSATIGAGPAAAGPARPPDPAAPGRVNLNTASEAELDGLPGVGPVTAAAIAAWRQANGRFTDIEQLGEVDGIGPARLEKLRALVTV
ncbi:competence protein ComEA [Rhodococcus sp. PvR044]|uniref:ComEA family DNA-binding protein n=1 Tax=Rhodococcus TaxID=1827 RepID=UPI000BD3481D|nr:MULTISPECIES: ComEA family DNA-binding protein [Rhodococcus]MCZ4556702.1 ComEA family DNA-binding protein [Rhodococcus maanshanensis]PTR43459.1 competence protein ComEA [Rhodococcus sp. OK611]SNX90804.1 competence protein ComEA [Rhodococcus sp. OK270]